MREDFDREWERLGEEVLSGIKEWRLQHPRATLREIEAAVDERLVRLRARMLKDAALASEAAEWVGRDEAPCCPRCGALLESDGTLGRRRLETEGGQQIDLKRQYATCPTCGVGFFPPG
jgi:ribosomal protein S27AE